MSVGTTISPISDLKFIKGQEVTIGGAPKGSVVIVEFWATWCPPCRTSIPHLTEVQQKFKDQGVIIIGVTSEKDDGNKITDFVKEMGDKMDYIVAIDENGSAKKAIFVPSGARGIPTAFILVNNQIVWTGHPLDDAFESEIQSAIENAKA